MPVFISLERDFTPPNAFKILTLRARIAADFDLTLERGIPPTLEVFSVEPPSGRRLNFKEEHPELNEMPPPGCSQLCLVMGQELGRGRAGRAYQAHVNISSSSPEVATMKLPPLVVKISRPNRSGNLAREAYIYEQMECLQGSVVPRYYGMYQSIMSTDSVLEPWSSILGPWQEDTSDTDSEESVSDDSEEEHSPKLEGGVERAHEQAQTVTVTALVLERLGGPVTENKLRRPARLPWGGPIADMYRNLFLMGISHGDCKSNNILQVLRAPNSLPDRRSPFREVSYPYRLIDFDCACETDQNLDILIGGHHLTLLI